MKMKKHWIWMAAVVFAALLLCGAAAAEEPYVEIFPRQSMPVNGPLEFSYIDFDTAVDQYAHVLKEETDGTLTAVASMKVWDAASGTGVNQIEPGMVTETGSYWLALGPDPDYTGLEGGTVASTPFTAVENQLAMPVIENLVYGSQVGTDVSFSIVYPEGAAMVYVELGRIDENGDFIVEYWDNYGSEFNVLGLFTTTPGTYQIRAVACPQDFGEPASETLAESETAVCEFTMAPGEIPECPAPVLSVTEADFDPEQTLSVSYTIPGAEAVTCGYDAVSPGTEDYAAGTGFPIYCTAGDTGIMYADVGPGEYHVYCWGRFGGVWSKVGEAVFTLNPLGYLEIPAATLNLQVLSVTCENAEVISCEVMKEMLNGEYEWMDWIDWPADDTGTVQIDLNDLGLDEGTYQLRFVPYREGWLNLGDKIINVTVGETAVQP